MNCLTEVQIIATSVIAFFSLCSFIIAMLIYKITKKKRKDDLFKIRYGWFDRGVIFAGEAARIKERSKDYRSDPEWLENWLRYQPSNLAQIIIENLAFQQTQIDLEHLLNKIQRHLSEGILIFKDYELELKKQFMSDMEAINKIVEETTTASTQIEKLCDYFMKIYNIKTLMETFGPIIQIDK